MRYSTPFSILLTLLAACAASTPERDVSGETAATSEGKPYEVSEVRYTSKDGSVELTGTLSLPNGHSQLPAVYLIPGATPFDRDQSFLGHRPFQVWADYLTRRGFAVLRMDDRGVGASTGQKMMVGLSTLTDDVLQGLAFLANHPRIDSSRMGLIGHSLGGAIAPLVASRNPEVAFIVLLAGPGTSFLEIQAYSKAKEGIGNEVVNLNVARRVIAALQDTSNPEWEAVDATVRPYISALDSEGTRQSATEFFDAIGPVATRFLQAPLFRDYLAYDPAPVLARVRCPVLALGGDKDVDISRTLPAIATALEGNQKSPYTISKLTGINHLLQLGENDEEQWQRSEHAVAPVVLETVQRWLADQAVGEQKYER